MSGFKIVARYRCAAALLAGMVLTGCTSSPAPPETATPAATAASGADQHAVVGKAPITITGTPAVVILEPQHKTPMPEQKHVSWLDQASRTFFPEIVFTRAGKSMEFRNSDPELHNINVKDMSTRKQAFNIALPPDEKFVHTFEQPGVYDVSCDVHPGMSAQIIASTSPYATISDSKGNFTFPDVIPGPYTMTVYAGRDAIRQTIEVAGPKTEINVSSQ